MGNLVSYQDSNILENAIALLNRVNKMQIPLDVPIAGAIGQTAGGALTLTTKYYYKFAAIDASGNESFPSAETSFTLTSSNQSMTFGAASAVLGAISYVGYRTTTSGVYSGSFPLTSSQWTTGFTDTGSGGFVLAGSNQPISPVPSASNTRIMKAFYTLLQDSIISTYSTVANLIAGVYPTNNTPIQPAPGISIEDQNFCRALYFTLLQLQKISTKYDQPVITSVADAGSGSGVTNATYYVKVTLIDEQGRESVASAESSITIANTHSITITVTAQTNVKKYRIYIGTQSGGQNSYFESVSNVYTYTGSAGTTGTPPLSKDYVAGPAVITDADCPFSTFQSLLTLIAGKANSVNLLDTTRSTGEQAE